MTTERLIKKINLEYEFFYMDMIKTSRENLFAKSEEIYRKKAIISYLKKVAGSHKNLNLTRLCTADNLLDEFYRYVIDHEEKEMAVALNEYMKNYLEEK